MERRDFLKLSTLAGMSFMFKGVRVSAQNNRTNAKRK